LLEAGANTTTATGTPAILPLHLAVQRGRLPIVQILVEFGANVNASSQDTKSTALHYASAKGTWDIVLFLIKKGSLVEERDVSGATPCILAARAKHWHVVRKFTKFSDLNATDFNGLGALHYAISSGSISVVRFLNKHCPGLTQDIRDREGKLRGSTLTCAIRSGNIDVFQMFWGDRGKHFISDYGCGLAHFAVGTSENGIRNLLLPHITDWNLDTACLWLTSEIPGLLTVKSPRGLLPLHIAASFGNVAAITFLNDNNLIPDINALTAGEEAYSSLHLAARFSQLKTVKLLANMGAELDLKDKVDGQKPLHIAARFGFASIVTALLGAGCKPNPMDANGMTAELLAIENDHHTVAKLLTEHLDSLESKADLQKDSNSSTSRLDMRHRKPWRLPLAQTPHMSKVVTGNMSIYAVHDTDGPEGLYKALEECKDQGVYNLGKPFKRLV
jgi:ankyrin repeat protein